MNMWFNACHAEDSDRRPGIGHFRGRAWMACTKVMKSRRRA